MTRKPVDVSSDYFAELEREQAKEKLRRRRAGKPKNTDFPRKNGRFRPARLKGRLKRS